MSVRAEYSGKRRWRVAVLCREKLSSRCFLHELQRHHDIVQVVYEQSGIFTQLRSLWRCRRRDGLWMIGQKFLFLLYYGIFCRRGDEDEFRRCFGRDVDSSIMALKTPLYGKVMRTYNINDSGIYEQTLSSEPDVVVVFGTSILRGLWLDATLPVLNVHYGLPRHYRGSFCGFWALFCEDWDNVGVSVHYIDNKVDHGRIVSERVLERSKVMTIDSLGKLMAYQLMLAIEVLNDALVRVDKGSECLPGGEGRLFSMPSLQSYLEWKSRARRQRERAAAY